MFKSCAERLKNKATSRGLGLDIIEHEKTVSVIIEDQEHFNYLDALQHLFNITDWMKVNPAGFTPDIWDSNGALRGVE